MLRLLAYFDNQEVWYDLLCIGLSGDLPEWLRTTLEERTSFESTMGTLVDYCLVEVQHRSQSYSMHNCVHDWTLGELNATITSDFYWYAFDCVAENIKKDDWDVLAHATYSRISQHAIRLTHSRFEKCNVLEVGIFGREHKAGYIAHMLREQVQLLAAEQMYVRALVGYKKALGSDHISTLGIVNNLGSLYTNRGKLNEAEAMYLRALAGLEKVLGPEHSSTRCVVRNLDNLRHAQRKTDQLME